MCLLSHWSLPVLLKFVTEPLSWVDRSLQGRIQFYIEALDRVVSLSEVKAIINTFPINLELQPGPDFTTRVSYTGTYNIPGLRFDMSFRVQCSENYYGPNCSSFCEPLEDVYTCDSRGRTVCVQGGGDPATNCMTCFPNWEPKTNCTTCLFFYDIQADCTRCVVGRDINTNCITCTSTWVWSINQLHSV